jgi:hypothetical protein
MVSALTASIMDNDYIMIWCGLCNEVTEHDFAGCVKHTGVDWTKKGKDEVPKTIREKDPKKYVLGSSPATGSC